MLYRDTHATAPRALTGARCLLAASIVVTFALMISASGAWAAQTCTPEAAIATSSPFYNVENSDSPGGSTCLTVSPTSVSFRVDSSSYDTSDGVPADQQFTGYMAVFTGCKHGGCLEPNYPAQASRIRSEVTSWSFNFSATGRYDAVYDAYFNTTPTEQNVPTGAELMIWLNEQNVALIGPQLPDVTIDGTQWHVFDVYKKTPVGNWNRIAFERVTPVTNVSNLDLAPFVQAAISDGAIAPDWYQQDLEAGFEIWYGGVGLTTYSFSANPPTLTPLSTTGSGGTGGTGSGGTGGSGGAGSRTTGSTEKATSKPTVSLALPECSTTISKRKCAALRRTAGAWRHVVGMAADDTAVTRVTVTAVRVGQKHAKRKTVKVRAKFISRTAWKATIPGLTKGRWRFTATATDTAGLTRTTRPITVSINVGLPAS